MGGNVNFGFPLICATICCYLGLYAYGLNTENSLLLEIAVKQEGYLELMKKSNRRYSHVVEDLQTQVFNLSNDEAQSKHYAKMYKLFYEKAIKLCGKKPAIRKIYDSK